MTRRHRGNVPDDGQLVSSATIDGIHWRLYIRPQIYEHWRNFKLVADGRAPGKANYWFGWCERENRFARRDIVELQMRYWPVYEWLKLEMTDPATARLLYGS